MRKQYDFGDRIAVVTGGTGILGGEIAAALAGAGANVSIIDIKTEVNPDLQARFDAAPGIVECYQGSVLDRKSLEEVAAQILKNFGRIDILVNGAGGNHPQATTGPDASFFNIPQDAFDKVSGLNLLGTVLPSQVFGRHFAQQEEGVILNVSSMNAFTPLTKIPAYSAAKAAVSNFTQWLAVHMAQEYSPRIRINAIAPGFFLTDQNRFLLTDENTGELTPRGKTILEHTPLGRFGDPKDLMGAVLWLLSSDSEFVTGIVLPIDGGFSAFSGV